MQHLHTACCSAPGASAGPCWTPCGAQVPRHEPVWSQWWQTRSDSASGRRCCSWRRAPAPPISAGAAPAATQMRPPAPLKKAQQGMRIIHSATRHQPSVGHALGYEMGTAGSVGGQIGWRGITCSLDLQHGQASDAESAAGGPQQRDKLGTAQLDMRKQLYGKAQRRIQAAADQADGPRCGAAYPDGALLKARPQCRCERGHFHDGSQALATCNQWRTASLAQLVVSPCPVTSPLQHRPCYLQCIQDHHCIAMLTVRERADLGAAVVLS